MLGLDVFSVTLRFERNLEEISLGDLSTKSMLTEMHTLELC